METGEARRTYSSDLKSEAVELAANSGQAMAEVRREPGLPDGLLSRGYQKPDAMMMKHWESMQNLRMVYVAAVLRLPNFLLKLGSN